VAEWKSVEKINGKTKDPVLAPRAGETGLSGRPMKTKKINHKEIFLENVKYADIQGKLFRFHC
jgi:hypothetical protein